MTTRDQLFTSKWRSEFSHIAWLGSSDSSLALEPVRCQMRRNFNESRNLGLAELHCDRTECVAFCLAKPGNVPEKGKASSQAVLGAWAVVVMCEPMFHSSFEEGGCLF